MKKFLTSVSVKTIVRLREWSYWWYKVEVVGGKGSEAVAKPGLNTREKKSDNADT